MLGINGILFIITEATQMYLNLKGYFMDFWNLYDLTRILLNYSYIIMQNIMINRRNNLEDVETLSKCC